MAKLVFGHQKWHGLKLLTSSITDVRSSANVALLGKRLMADD